MTVIVTSAYTGQVIPHHNFKGGNGQSFLVTTHGKHILFDAGWRGRVLLHNLASLDVEPKSISALVISHGHRDHTGGVPALLAHRDGGGPLRVIGHPAVREEKVLGTRALHLSFGWPPIGRKDRKSCRFEGAREPVEVLPGIFTSGEITVRNEAEGFEKQAWHRDHGGWRHDHVMDDQSLVIRARGGLVVVTGCAHAGLLNILAHAEAKFKAPIYAIVGGTHLMRATPAEIDALANVLAAQYHTPRLFLNHCTGKQAYLQLKKRLGARNVHACPVGTQLIFETGPC